MNKLLSFAIIFCLVLAGCVQQPEVAPLSELERATEKITPQQIEELDAGEPEPSHYSVLERGNAYVQGQRPAVNATIPPAVKKKAAKEQFPLLNLEDASLWEVIKIIADFRGWNYVIDPDVPDKGINIRINESISGLDVENALHLLLSIHGVAMVEHDGLVYFVEARGSDYKLGAPVGVGTDLKDGDLGQGWVTQIVPLHFVAPGEMSQILKEFISPNGQMVEDSAGSMIVIIDRLPYVQKALDVVRLFDINVFKNKQMALIRLENASAKNVLENIEKIFDGYGGLKEGKYFLSTIEDMNALICITSIKEIIDEVKFWAEKFEKESEVGEARIFIYHVENAKASDLATIIKEIYAEDHAEAKGEDGKVVMRPVLKSDFKIVLDEPNNALIFKTTKRDYSIIEKTLKQLDQPKKQVLIEVMILDLSLSDGFSYGFNWFIRHDDSLTWSPQLDFTPGAQEGGFTGAYNFIFSRFQLESLLNANEVKSRTNVLSTPHILVLDNEEATIDVGEQISIQTGSVSTPAATQTTTSGFYNSSSFQYLQTGVKLQVKPSVSSNGLVRLEVNQTYSTPGTSSGGMNPPIKNRSAQTIISVPDGKSVLIGGMIQETKTNSDDGVPILSRIPLIKYFFTNKSVNTSKSELILIITPRVLYNHEDAVTITEEFRKDIDQFRIDLYGAGDDQ